MRALLILGRDVQGTVHVKDPRQQQRQSAEKGAREPTARTRSRRTDSSSEEDTASPEHGTLMKAAQERHASQTEEDSSGTESDADAEPAGAGRCGVGEPMTSPRASKARVLSDWAGKRPVQKSHRWLCIRAAVRRALRAWDKVGKGLTTCLRSSAQAK